MIAADTVALPLGALLVAGCLEGIHVFLSPRPFVPTRFTPIAGAHNDEIPELCIHRHFPVHFHMRRDQPAKDHGTYQGELGVEEAQNLV